LYVSLSSGKISCLTLTIGANLPKNISWLEKSKIAGCARPETETELKAAKEQGVQAIISLTGTPLNPEVVNRQGFEYLHSHVSGAPSVEQLDEIIKFIEKKNAQSKPVLVHCGEGKGRTGTVLAAYLVHHGLSADEAIRTVRQKRPGSIENLEQENAIHEFEKHLKKRQHSVS
jgi:atypical dual specificity phosphatase